MDNELILFDRLEVINLSSYIKPDTDKVSTYNTYIEKKEQDQDYQEMLHSDAPSAGVHTPAAPEQHNRAEHNKVGNDVHFSDAPHGKRGEYAETGRHPFPVLPQRRKKEKGSKKITCQDCFTDSQCLAVISRHHTSGRRRLLMQEF